MRCSVSFFFAVTMVQHGFWVLQAKPYQKPVDCFHIEPPFLIFQSIQLTTLSVLLSFQMIINTQVRFCKTMHQHSVNQCVSFQDLKHIFMQRCSVTLPVMRHFQSIFLCKVNMHRIILLAAACFQFKVSCIVTYKFAMTTMHVTEIVDGPIMFSLLWQVLCDLFQASSKTTEAKPAVVQDYIKLSRHTCVK
jgi:hypothetical protein